MKRYIKSSYYSGKSTHPKPLYEYILVDDTQDNDGWDLIATFDNQRDAEDYAQDEGATFSHIGLYLVISEYDHDGEYYPSEESPILLREYENGRRIK